MVWKLPIAGVFFFLDKVQKVCYNEEKETREVGVCEK